MERTSYVLSSRIMFFYLVTTGWIFDTSLCENPIDQSIMAHIFSPRFFPGQEIRGPKIEGGNMLVPHFFLPVLGGGGRGA